MWSSFPWFHLYMKCDLAFFIQPINLYNKTHGHALSICVFYLYNGGSNVLSYEPITVTSDRSRISMSGGPNVEVSKIPTLIIFINIINLYWIWFTSLSNLVHMNISRLSSHVPKPTMLLNTIMQLWLSKYQKTGLNHK